MSHNYTRTADFPITAEDVPYYFGTFSQAQFDARETLASAAIITLLRGTGEERQNFSSPFTAEYAGNATENRYACLFIPNSFTIDRVSSEGFVFDTVSYTPAGSERTLWVVNASLSAGSHEVTWRAS